jgi:NAD(P)H-flavin reductase
MAKVQNPYYPMEADILEVIEETPTIKTFVLQPQEPIPFKAGQFMELTVPGLGEAPFTPSSSPHQADKISITILRTGTVTDALHEMKAGQKLGLRGPFGKGFPVEKFQGKEVLVVGGGVGLAPLRSLLYTLFENIDKFKRVAIKYGARTPQELCFRREFEEWRGKKGVDMEVTIDLPAPGWDGKVGLVTVLLENLDVDLKDGYVVSCGPEIMLKFVTLRLLEEGFGPEQIYLSMNRNMSCGLGKCGHCIVGRYFLCKDGPDMNYADIMDVPNLFG